MVNALLPGSLATPKILTYHVLPSITFLISDQSKLSETEIDAGRVPGTQTKKATLLTGRLGEKVNKALQKAEKVKQKRTARAKQVILKYPKLFITKKY